jgi:hypothetical protein
MYMHEFPEMIPSDTGTMQQPLNTVSRGGNWRATLRAHGHLSIHSFPPSATFLQTRFGAPNHAARVQGPWSHHLVPHGGPPCTICALKSGPMACHSKSDWLASIQRPEVLIQNFPAKSPDFSAKRKIFPLIHQNTLENTKVHPIRRLERRTETILS